MELNNFQNGNIFFHFGNTIYAFIFSEINILPYIIFHGFRYHGNRI
jgi:hypothetical protein